ncbi:hypothetical protein C8J57DRAFT_1325231 [Mycena rebaudengoi]|nr:hypothetical protein C8J57DRAFT_1325231 [Mycena rebaudengoi]
MAETCTVEFPQELEDLIIDYMHGQKHALATCGLVSKAWLRSSRHLLFGWVSLRDHNWVAFLRLLNSPLATFTRAIQTLNIEVSDGAPGPTIDELIPHGGVSDLPINELIPQLPVFSSLERLRLADVNWNKLSAASVASLPGVFANITEFDLHHISFETPHQLATLVSSFTHLRKLSLHTITTRSESRQQQPHPPIVPCDLESARFALGRGNSAAVVDHFLGWLHIGERPPIRNIELGILQARNLPAVGSLLRALGPALHELDLAFTYYVVPAHIEKHIDLSRNTGLHSLTIHIGLRRPGSSRTTTDHAPWVLLVAPHSAITTLTIVLMVNGIEDFDKLDWGHLNTTLETRAQFAGLQRLQFIVHCPFSVDKMEGEIRERVRGQDSRGRVYISVLLSSRIFTHGL